MSKSELALKILKIINDQIDECLDEELTDQAFILDVVYKKIAQLSLEECLDEH